MAGSRSRRFLLACNPHPWVSWCRHLPGGGACTVDPFMRADEANKNAFFYYYYYYYYCYYYYYYYYYYNSNSGSTVFQKANGP